MEINPDKKIEKINRFREWYKLLDSYGEDGRRLMRVEYRYWKYLWQSKKVGRSRAERTTRHGKFKVVSAYSKEREEKDFKEFRDSFLKGERRQEGLKDSIGTVLKNIGNIETEMVKYFGPEVLKSLKGIIMFGSGYIGPKDLEKDPHTDIDIAIIVDDEFYKMLDLRKKNDWNYWFPNEKKKTQILFLGESEENKPNFAFINFLAMPHMVIKSYIGEEKFKEIRNKVVEECVKDIDGLEEDLKSYEETLKFYKEERLIE